MENRHLQYLNEPEALLPLDKIDLIDVLKVVADNVKDACLPVTMRSTCAVVCPPP